MTISGSNRCLLVTLHGFNTLTSPSIHWDSTGTNQAMTSIFSFGGATTRIDTFLLVAPTAGTSLTISASWTNADSPIMGLVSFTGTDQVTCRKAADDSSAGPSTSPYSLAVTSAVGDATVAFIMNPGAGLVTTSQTELYNLSGLAAASYALGGSSNTHSWTGSNTFTILDGFHILAAATSSNKAVVIGGGVF
jgi:hypothetical protein